MDAVTFTELVTELERIIKIGAHDEDGDGYMMALGSAIGAFNSAERLRAADVAARATALLAALHKCGECNYDNRRVATWYSSSTTERLCDECKTQQYPSGSYTHTGELHGHAYTIVDEPEEAEYAAEIRALQKALS